MVITARNERHHPHSTHQAAGNRKGSPGYSGLRAYAERTQYAASTGSGALRGVPRRFSVPTALSGQPFVLMCATYDSSSSSSSGALGWIPGDTGSLQVHVLRGVLCPQRRQEARPLSKAQPTQHTRLPEWSRVSRESKEGVESKSAQSTTSGCRSRASGPVRCSWSGVSVGFFLSFDGNWLRLTNVIDKRGHSWVENRCLKGWKLNKGVSDYGDRVPKTQVESRNPLATVGNAGAARVTILQVTAGPKRFAAQEVVFQPTGLRDLKGGRNSD